MVKRFNTVILSNLGATPKPDKVGLGYGFYEAYQYCDQESMEKELCIRCGKPTPYNPNTPITLRRYFVEGSGQLCEKCFYELYLLPASLQSNLGEDYTPNEYSPIIPNSI